MGICALGLLPAVSAAAPGQGAAMGTLPPPPAVSSPTVPSSAVPSPAVPSPAVPSPAVPSPAVAAAAAELPLRRRQHSTRTAPDGVGPGRGRLLHRGDALGWGRMRRPCSPDPPRSDAGLAWRPVDRRSDLALRPARRSGIHGGDVLGGESHFGAVLFWLARQAPWCSSDGRAELIARRVWGLAWPSGFGGSSAPSVLIGYEPMPGLRYYLHPHVSLLAQAGLGGEYLVRTGTGSVAIGVHTLAARIGPALVL